MTPKLRLLTAAALTLAAAAFVPPASAAPRTVWLCKPGLKHNPCETSLRTAVFTPSGQLRTVRNVKPDRHRRIDCFYVYPTVSDQKTELANRHRDPEVRSIALYQAARYSQHCRVFAPVYRQRTLVGIAQPSPHGIVAARSYADVRNAWRQYLRRYNHGRGVVLIGHSQGSFVLRQLIAREVDRKPAVRRRLVSALLLGGNVLVKQNRDRGGDFKHLRACRSDHQLRCIVAFSTYNQTPPANSIFGRTAEKGREVLCTNPAALHHGAGRVDPIFPTEPFAPGSTIAVGISLLGERLPTSSAPWVEAPGSYEARCSSAGGANVLLVTARNGAPTLNPSPDAAWGLHLTDANIALGNLLDLVRTQARVYARRH